VILKKVYDKYPQLLPSLAGAVVLLLSGNEIEQFPEMPLSTRAEFFRSPLYQAYSQNLVALRYQKFVDDCRAGTIPCTSTIDELSKACTDESILEGLSFARLFFGGEQGKELLHQAGVLLEDTANFPRLEKLMPDHKLMLLKVFDESVAWKSISIEPLVKACYLLCSGAYEDAVNKISNLTVKRVLWSFKELRSILINAPASKDKENMKLIVRNLLLEMFAAKLGTNVEKRTEAVVCTDLVINDDVKDKFKKLLMDHTRKLKNFGPVTKMLLDKMLSEEELQQHLNPVVAPKKLAEKAESIEFKVGDVVVTRAVKSKDSFDSREAVVVTVKKGGKIRVKITDGPAAGTARDYSANMLTLKLKDDKPEDEDERNAKRARTAQELFGNLD
jgi:hypothetical protein